MTLACNGEPRVAILEKLAAAADFGLEIGALEPLRLTLRIENTKLEEVLPLLLGDVEYQVAYAFDRELGRHVMSSLRVGTLDAPPPVAGAIEAARERRELRWDEGSSARPAEAMREELRRANRERRARAEADRQMLFADLDSSEPEVRAEAASEIDPEGQALAKLAAMLAEDPDPRVREAALEQLAGVELHAAVDALIRALDDPDPHIVVLAIEAIENDGDESLVPEIEPLLDHRDSMVRDAAWEAIDALE